MGWAQQHALITLEEYLQGELQSDIRHEYAHGRVYAMSGASERHNLIAGNLFARLHGAAANQGCRVFMSDMKLRIDQLVYYPDLMVCCDASDADAYLKHRPCLIVEVLSPGTERIDRGEKLGNYRQLPSVQAILLLAQDSVRAELWRRAADGGFVHEVHEHAEAVLALPCPELTVSLAEIYARVRWS
ncbi:MAG: Uma2 family endonuclease [Xanthomonadales bacterium]|jgi:Uma2 family endonuclease|nr:Uma2 family endonuclease [Xanthomonadales bacterium]